MDLDIILENINFDENTGLLDEDICDLEKKIKFFFPVEYKEILKRFNGGYGNIGEFYIDFWEKNEILSYYEDIEDLNGLILFASDGCGMAFAFEKGDEAIFSIPMDCLEKSYSKNIANNFTDFLKKIVSGEIEY